MTDPFSGAPISVENVHGVRIGANLPFHTTTKQGRGTFITTSGVGNPVFRTRQEVYRYMAWLLLYTPALPDEDPNHSFECIIDAVKKAQQ